MGGCGGKKTREKRKAGTSTLGGKFSSIGSSEEQKANHRIIVEKLAEVIPLIRHVSSDDRLFLQDCKIKLNSYGSAASFGWRQVEAMMRIDTDAMAKEENGKRNRASSKGTSPANH